MKKQIVSLVLFLFVAGSGAPLAKTFKLKGKVCDTLGNPIAHVVVNDGVHFTQTDNKGNWRLESDTTVSKFVSISTPAAYKLGQTRGLASGHYVPMRDIVKTKKHRFILEKRPAELTSFYYIAISDPQVKNEHDMTRWKTEALPDLKVTVDSLKSSREVIGMTLGDLVFDSMHLYEEYKSSLQDMGMTVFQTIGNHDFNRRYASLLYMPKGSEVYAEMNYHKHFGPVNYSFNVGKVHVITLKSIDYKGNKKYTEQLTPEEIDWIKHDLSYVPKGTIVFLNMHAAGWNVEGGGGNLRNAEKLSELLKGYRAHVFSGHTHFFQNVEPRKQLYQHNIGAACGAWWASWVNRCGAPNGYLVVDVNGDDVKWHYKSTRQDNNYQFRLYSPGQFLTQKDAIVANVWDWDAQCKVEWYQDGTLMGAMEQFVDADQTYRETINKQDKVLNTPHLFRAVPSASAKSVRVVFTNRFGEQYSQTLSLEPVKLSRIIAHRGYWQTASSAQNSIAALEKADSIGTYGSEFDVQRTKDGVLVVNHDPTINGVKISEVNYADIKDMTLKNGETLPTLAEYLAKGGKNKVAKMIVEIKEQPTPKDEDKCVDRVLKLVREGDYLGDVEYISFSKRVCQRLHDRAYGAKISYLGGDLTPQQVKDMGLTGIDYSAKAYKKHPEWISEAKKLGLTVNVWTVNDPKEITYFLAQGVDFVTTNNPVEGMEIEKKM
ncbi:MAG: calcineurin-like phosphoesterase C-terminal domain-containing protein [Prevotella sp.]|jgi:glycerophosphoryl diester phosphodiesterase